MAIFDESTDRPHPHLGTSPLRVLVFGAETYVAAPLPDSGIITFGRANDCHVRVQDPSISRVHAQIRLGATELSIEDLGSANGTRVRGRALKEGEHVAFEPGDVIDLGSTTLVVQRVERILRPRRLWSRGDFLQRLEEECERAHALGTTFALVSIELPSSARAVAEPILVGVTRSFDVVGTGPRGEFDILMPGATETEAGSLVAILEGELARRNVEGRTRVVLFPDGGRTAADLMFQSGARVVENTRDVNGADAPILWPEAGPMRAVLDLIARIAPSNLNVLILGETGVGKDVIAAEIQRTSRRSASPFARVGCGRLGENGLRDLMGQERPKDRESQIGLLESCVGGTMLLDEVTSLPHEIQSGLLRVLEEQQFFRLGAIVPTPLDVRILSTTSGDVLGHVQSGRLRPDLYYRLNGVTVVIPPLRERRSEIEPLARAFAQHALLRSGSSAAAEFEPEALAMLVRHTWPGNIRELRNVIERAVLLSEDGLITRLQLPIEQLTQHRVKPYSPARATVPPPAPSPAESNATFTPENEEGAKIMAVLESCGGNQTRAAAVLGISRGTLQSRLEAYGIPRPRKKLS